jgi:hypothetical protein
MSRLHSVVKCRNNLRVVDEEQWNGHIEQYSDQRRRRSQSLLDITNQFAVRSDGTRRTEPGTWREVNHRILVPETESWHQHNLNTEAT